MNVLRINFLEIVVNNLWMTQVSRSSVYFYKLGPYNVRSTSLVYILHLTTQRLTYTQILYLTHNVCDENNPSNT